MAIPQWVAESPWICIHTKLALVKIWIRYYIPQKKFPFMKCKNCSKDLFESRHKFCSINCQDDYIANLEKIVEKAVKNDMGHTRKISETL